MSEFIDDYCLSRLGVAYPGNRKKADQNDMEKKKKWLSDIMIPNTHRHTYT